MDVHGVATLPGPGDVVDGKYRLERLLGQGGMGAVYAARHVKLGHAVAIKVMLAAAGNVEATQRFLNEGRAAVNIQHENVVRGSDLGEENGYAFMVLELLDGEDLDQVLEREIRLAPNVAVNYVLQALRGVGQAHAQGIIHRDLKPANLFLVKRADGTSIVKVLDFGISKSASGGALGMAPNQLTSTATMLGSPLYMSPEQLRSSKKVDARADIWAIGVILFELISGERPFNGETLGELFSSILETEAPRLSSRVPSVPQGLDAIVARCLQRRPEDRYASAADLERELAPFAMIGGGATSAMPFSGAAQAHHPAPNTGPYPVSSSFGGGAGPAVAGAVTGPYGPQASAQQGAMAPSSPGNPAGPPIMPGTVPLGAMSPVPFQQTTGSGAAWQTGAQQPAPSRSKAPVAFFAGCALLLLVGGGLFAASKLRSHAANGTTVPSVSASAPLPADTVVASASPLPVQSAAPIAATAASSAPTTPTTPVTPVAGLAPKHQGGALVAAAKPEPPKTVEPPKVVEPPKPEPPKPEPPKVTPPPPKPPPAVTASPQQNSR